jgi:hypothetical protein
MDCEDRALDSFGSGQGGAAGSCEYVEEVQVP